MEHRLIKMADSLPLVLGERLPRKGEGAAELRAAIEYERRETELSAFERIDHTFNHSLAHEQEKEAADYGHKLIKAPDYMSTDAEPFLPKAPKPTWWNGDCRLELPFSLGGLEGMRRYSIDLWQKNAKSKNYVKSAAAGKHIQAESLRLLRLMPELEGSSLWLLYMEQVWQCTTNCDFYNMVGKYEEVNAAWIQTFTNWCEWTWQRHSMQAWDKQRKDLTHWMKGTAQF